MAKLKKNFALIFLCLVSFVFFSVELSTSFLAKTDVEQIIVDNKGNIEQLFAGETPQLTVSNEYFDFALPTGMEIFAEDKNNLKLRYEKLFFEVHVFTSKIDSLDYSKVRFPNEKLYNLNFLATEKVFFYVKDLGNNNVQIAMYKAGVEIIVNAPKYLTENVILKSAEILRNTTARENDNNNIFIGGGNDAPPKDPNTNLEFDDGAEDSDTNTEMPIVKS